MFLRFPGGRAKALTLSYDDGVIEDKRLLSIMEAHGVKGTFNLNSGCFAPEGTVHAEGEGHYRMTASACRELYASEYAEVACHSLTHPFLDQLTAPEVMRELLEDRQNLERMTGRVVRGFAYPYGAFNAAVAGMLRAAGFAYARTVISTGSFELPADPMLLPATCHHNDPRLNELADRFLALDPDSARGSGRSPKLFYLWGHAYEFYDNDNWQVIEDFLDKVAGKDDIWYATNIDIFDYIEAFGRLRLSADLRTVENPTAADVWLNEDGRTVRVPAGQTVRL